MSLPPSIPLRYTNRINFLPVHLNQKWQYNPLPYQQFQALLTLFSKFFSSFPHGTCSLSVSHQYLALGEIYHPLSARFPTNATLRIHTVRKIHRTNTGLSPSLVSHSREIIPTTLLVMHLETTILTLRQIFNLCFSLFNRLY